MKRISFILFTVLTFLCSCENVLEKTPDGQITLDKMLSNYSRSRGLLDVAYGEIYLGRDYICFIHNTIEALTDNTYWADTYNAYEWHNGSLSLSNPVIDWQTNSPRDQLWADFWRGIRLANNAINICLCLRQ